MIRNGVKSSPAPTAPHDPRATEPLVWRDPDGKPVSCVEKIKVLNENIAEIRQLCQDALEDAVLMGCDEAQMRAVLRGLIDALETDWSNKR